MVMGLLLTSSELQRTICGDGIVYTMRRDFGLGIPRAAATACESHFTIIRSMGLGRGAPNPFGTSNVDISHHIYLHHQRWQRNVLGQSVGILCP